MAYGYDPQVDYQKLINQDLANQDYRSAAIHEAQRNEKIAGEGATKYKPTSNYSDYLPKDQQVNAGIAGLQRGAYTYDPSSDPAYQALRRQALREADRATLDTMGTYAAMTGGVPSTAAVSAAQQAGAYERAKLNDAIPTLAENAYQRALQGVQLLQGQEQQALSNSLLLRQQAGAEQQQGFANELALRQQAFAEQQQALQNAMNRWAVLGAADQQVASVLGVPVGTPTTDERYQQLQQQMAERQQTFSEGSTLWQQGQTEQGTARELALYLLQLGQMPNDQILAAAGPGFDKATAQQLLNGYAAQAAAAARGGGGGGGGSNPKKKEEPTALTPEEQQALRTQGIAQVYAMTPSSGMGSYAAQTIGNFLANPTINNLSSFGKQVYNGIPSRVRSPQEAYQYILDRYDKSGLSDAEKEHDLYVFLKLFGQG